MTKSILTLSLLTLLACGEEEKTEGMTPGDCTDGADNDGDGDFDCDDDGCAGSPVCSGTNDSGTEDTGGSNTSDDPSVDNDGDGVSENDGDCDDSDATIYPGALDTTVDGVDQDCNNFDGPDSDGDGFAPESAGGTDCDDSNAAINPDASEDFNDGLDNDCDGYADMSNVQCAADMSIEFADSETVTLDFCQRWSLESTFEYDPDNPPELNSISLNMNATSEVDFDCSIQIEQEGICGEGYYRQGLSTGTTVMATMDCSGVSDENEQTLNFSEGYLRIDSIDTGNQSGSFAGQSLSTGLVGHLHVWNADGNDLEGDISISVEQLATDAEENVCTVLDAAVIDEDGDGFLSQYFDGEDCDDNELNSTTVSVDGDCDGALAINDCDDNDASIYPDAFDVGNDGIDQNCDGVDSNCNLTTCDTNLYLGTGLGIDMVFIPAGDDPLARYTLTNDFYMMTTEVTQGMFSALMSYDPTTYWTADGVGNNYPAYYVSWYMAADFANMVTQYHNSINGTSLQECYTCSNSGTTSVTCTEAVNPYQCTGYVLPTEAEWEYAARSGTQYDFWTPDGGGNYNTNSCSSSVYINDGVSNPLLSNYAWFCGNASGSKEVGQKLPNDFGLYDMHGNIAEWTADWMGCGFPTSTIDPFCDLPEYWRMIRGGGWQNYPSNLMSIVQFESPGDRYSMNSFGFRLVLH